MRNQQPVIVFIVVLILLVAFWMRIANIHTVPPGYSYDAVSYIADALRIAKGIPYPLYFDARPEPLYRFLLAAWFVIVQPMFFTGYLFQAFIGLIGVALAYRAGLEVLRGSAYRHTGAIITAGALAAAMPHLFLSRATYRASLLMPVIWVAFILMLRAARSARGRDWFFAGGGAALGIHAYLAGIMALPWLAVFWLHQTVLQPKPRSAWRLRILFGIGASLVFLPWALLVLFVPNLFSRVSDASAFVVSKTLPERLIDGIPVMLQALIMGNDPIMLFNRPNTPPLNVFLTLLAFIGLLVAVWRWRTVQSTLILSGLTLFTLPALLSNDANSSVRLMGTVPFLCLLAGMGITKIFDFAPQLWQYRKNFVGQIARHPDNTSRKQRIFAASIGLCMVIFSMVATHRAYQGFFATEALYDPPNADDSIPLNYTIAYVEILQYLTQITEPTYVPLRAVNTEMAYFVLQHEAYTTITTWARYGLTELPAGQIFYPEFEYFHLVFTPEEPLQVLLLPQEKTIVILPPMWIRRPEGDEVTLIHHPKYDWVIGRSVPRPAEKLPERTLPDLIPTFGDGLELITPPQNLTLTPDTMITQVVEWRVTAPQPADVVSVLQIMDTDYNAISSSEHRVLSHLYPSPLWQPGDIIPDSHTLTLPETIPDKLYRLAAGIYIIPYQDRQLPINNPGAVNYLQNLWLWGVGRANPPAQENLPENAMPLNVTFGEDIHLLGYTLEKADLNWTLNLYWQTESLPEQDLILFVHALDADGNLIAQRDEIPNNGQTPLWSWLPEIILHTQHNIQLPAEPDRLNIGMYHPLTFERIPVTENGENLPESVLPIWQE